MTDYITMQTRIADELNRGGLTNQIKYAILDALKFNRRNRYTWNNARTVSTVQAGDEYMKMPTDFVEADVLSRQDGDWLVPMTEVSDFWITQNKTSVSFTGPPRYWASVENQEIRFYPPADKDYALELWYQFELPIPVNDADTSDWFTKGEELIRLRAKADLLENVIRGPDSFQEAAMLRAREAEIAKQFRKEWKRASSSGRISVDVYV